MLVFTPIVFIELEAGQLSDIAIAVAASMMVATMRLRTRHSARA